MRLGALQGIASTISIGAIREIVLVPMNEQAHSANR